MDLLGKEHLPEQADIPVIEGMNGEQINLISKIYQTYSRSAPRTR
jgi:hypothetical protein